MKMKDVCYVCFYVSYCVSMLNFVEIHRKESEKFVFIPHVYRILFLISTILWKEILQYYVKGCQKGCERLLLLLVLSLYSSHS